MGIEFRACNILIPWEKLVPVGQVITMFLIVSKLLDTLIIASCLIKVAIKVMVPKKTINPFQAI